MIKNDVGKRIKELRIAKGISQEDLALKCGLDRTYITYIENAKKNVTIETLHKITQALDISLSEFFAMEETTTKVTPKEPSFKITINDLEKNKIYTNNEVAAAFKCSPQGGIRVSKTLKTATLISHLSSKVNPYNDSNINNDGKFIYTGMGLKGDQIVKPTNQNGKVAYSNKNGYRLFYFISIDKNKYKFIGEVKLVGDYYFEDEEDSDGNLRKVAKFPLQLI